MLKIKNLIPALVLCFFLMPTTNAISGESVMITLKGNPLTLRGETLQVGQMLPRVLLPDRSLKMIDLKSLNGKITILTYFNPGFKFGVVCFNHFFLLSGEEWYICHHSMNSSLHLIDT